MGKNIGVARLARKLIHVIEILHYGQFIRVARHCRWSLGICCHFDWGWI